MNIRGAAPETPLGPEAPNPHCATALSRSREKGFETRIMIGKEASPFASEFWGNLDDGTRRIMLWDVAEEMRAAILAECWERADCVILARMDGRIAAAAWASRIGPQSACGMIHFCFAREARVMALEIGKNALNALFEATVFQSLIGLIPAKFGHALRFVERLGFAVGARLAQTCPVYLKADCRLFDGVLATLNRKDFMKDFMEK